MMPRKQPGRFQAGIALISVLWVLALLTIVASALSFSVRSEAKFARNVISNAQARHAAEGGIYLGLERLLARSMLPRPDYAAYEFAVGEASVSVVVADEAGKIDLNAAPPELLDGLLRIAGVEAWQRTDIVDAILDWRDADEATRINGAEDHEYQAAGKTYGAKDAPFDSVDELKLVLGMSPQLFRKIRPALTVYSRQRGINPAAASRLVLLAVPGMGADTVDAYLQLRRESGASGLSPPPPSIDGRYRAGATGAIYTIRSRARLAGDIVTELAATVALRGVGEPAFSILSWDDDAQLAGT